VLQRLEGELDQVDGDLEEDAVEGEDS